MENPVNDYLKSKKRLVLLVALFSYVVYTIISDNTSDTAKLLGIGITPLYLIGINDCLRRRNK